MSRMFSDQYAAVRGTGTQVREQANFITENLLQDAWRTQPWPAEELRTVEGHRLRVVSPGWLNRQEGPDFRTAQLLFNGVLHTGDVEIHLRAGGWRAHGHHDDPRYNDVILHVVHTADRNSTPARTRSGRNVATLALESLLSEQAIESLSPETPLVPPAGAICGHCAETVAGDAPDKMLSFLRLAGEWRMLSKARALQERAEAAGCDQALYEAFMTACGYSRFKKEFHLLARQLPYDRARQLARLDPLALETAFLTMTGLLPTAPPESGDPATVEHHRRLTELRQTHLPGLRALAVEWPRVGVRPANAPERRLSGAARVIARTAPIGLAEAVESVWAEALPAKERLDKFESLFPRPMGFWASHYTWNGKAQSAPVAIFGAARILAIVGNVFLPAGLALARRTRNRTLEESVLAFFEELPGEPDNIITKRMKTWVLPRPPRRISFQLQQGLIQMHHDWCETNPSCRNCSFARYFESVAP